MPITRTNNVTVTCSPEVCIEQIAEGILTSGSVDTFTSCDCGTDKLTLKGLGSVIPFFGLAAKVKGALAKKKVMIMQIAEAEKREAEGLKSEGEYLAAAKKHYEAGEYYLKASENILAAVSFHEAADLAKKAGDATMPPEWSDESMPAGRKAINYWHERRMVASLKEKKDLPADIKVQIRAIVAADGALFNVIKETSGQTLGANKVITTMNEIIETNQPQDAIRKLNEFVDCGGVKFAIKVADKWGKKIITPETTIHDGTYPSFLKQWERHQITLRVKASVKEIEAGIDKEIERAGITDRKRIDHSKALQLANAAHNRWTGSNKLEEVEVLARLGARAVDLYLSSGSENNRIKMAETAYWSGKEFAKAGLDGPAIKYFKLSVQFYSAAEQISDATSALIGLGDALQRAGRHAEAVKSYLMVEKYNPNYLLGVAEALTKAAESFERLGQFEKALGAIDAARKKAYEFHAGESMGTDFHLRPGDCNWHAKRMMVRGRILAQQGRYADAIDTMAEGKKYWAGGSLNHDSAPPDEEHLKLLEQEIGKVKRMQMAQSSKSQTGPARAASSAGVELERERNERVEGREGKEEGRKTEEGKKGLKGPGRVK